MKVAASSPAHETLIESLNNGGNGGANFWWLPCGDVLCRICSLNALLSWVYGIGFDAAQSH